MSVGTKNGMLGNSEIGAQRIKNRIIFSTTTVALMIVDLLFRVYPSVVAKGKKRKAEERQKKYKKERRKRGKEAVAPVL